jgi:3-oxoacyl-[acyl-carrier protein] reductase
LTCPTNAAMDLALKAAIVTGAATGIGRETALRLADLGCSVTINYSKSEKEALVTAGDVEKRSVRALAVCGDVANEVDCRRVVEKTVATFGRLDVLVNNAATTVFVPHENLDGLTDEMWDRIFAVNVKGAFQMARAARPHLRASGEGAIVNVSSTAGATGGGSSIPYAASKAALETLTVSLARVFAPEVRVNCVAPGFTDTAWLSRGYGDRIDVIRQQVKRQTPLRDAGRPEHVAQVIISMITSMDWVTGEVVVVDGGFSMRNG